METIDSRTNTALYYTYTFIHSTLFKPCWTGEGCDLEITCVKQPLEIIMVIMSLEK